MSLKDTWTPQTETMDAIPDIPNMLADAIIQNESDIVKAQSTADSANKTAAALSEQLGDMNVAIQANTDGILNTNSNVSQLAERVDQNETDIKELQESGGSGEQEIFVVTCQTSYIDETTNVAYPLTVDKSIKEIIDAINEGKSIRAVMFKDGSDYFLSSTTYRTMQRTYTEYGWDSGENIEVPYDSVCFSFREPDSATVYEWIFTKISGDIDSFWEVNVSALADKTYVDNAVADAEEIVYINAEEVNGIITSDMDYNKAFEVINEGKTLVVKLISGIVTKLYTLSNVFDGYLEFSNTDYKFSETLTYWGKGTWENVKYQFATTDYVDNELEKQIGDFETALDSIITIQNQLMGVSE